MAREDTITTPRLLLLALTREELESLMAGHAAHVEQQRQITIPTAWLQSDLVDHLPVILAEMQTLANDERWVWVIIEAASRTLIGDVGFHQALTADATIEIGYAVLPAYHRQGYATEATRALVAWAFAQPEPQGIIAKILPDNVASLHVAANIGMHEVASDEADYRCFAVRRPS